MEEMSTAPLLTALESWLANRLLALHTALPGIVESFDGPEKCTATILPAINFKVPRGPVLKHRLIPGVPVIFPSSNSFRMSFNLEKGDGVLLLFSEASMGNWMEGAGQVDPEDSTRFSMHDAIAIAGLWNPSLVPKLAADEDFLLTSRAGARIGGTTTGLLDVSNEVTTLRAELERVYAQLNQLRSDLVSGFTALSGSTASPATLAAAFTAQSSVHSAALASVEADKLQLGGLLK